MLLVLNFGYITSTTLQCVYRVESGFLSHTSALHRYSRYSMLDEYLNRMLQRIINCMYKLFKTIIINLNLCHLFSALH